MALIEDLVLNATHSLSLAGESGLVQRLENRAQRGTAVITSSLQGLPAIAAESQQPFLIARDGEAAVVAHFTDSEDGAHGVHTHNPVIVRLVEGYVALAAQQKKGKG